MAAGCAVISTSIGAAGLNQNVKQAMRIVDSEAEFIQMVVSLLDDPALRNNLGHQAIEEVRQFYDWSALIPNLLNAYRELGLG